MAAVTNDVRPEDAVRDLIESWRRAAEAGGIEAIMSHYAPGFVAFDAAVRLQFKERDAYRKHWEACLSLCRNQIFEVHDLSITAEDDSAFCHYLCLCGGTGENGEKKTGWTRATVGCRRIGGRWMIVHEHYSAPFDMASGKALFDLQP